MKVVMFNRVRVPCDSLGISLVAQHMSQRVPLCFAPSESYYFYKTIIDSSPIPN